MRKRSKSTFIGAEATHYLNSQQLSEDEKEDKNFEIRELERSVDEDGHEEEFVGAEDSDEAILSLIQEVHAQIPTNDKQSYEERIDLIDWSNIKHNNAKAKISSIIESERKYRLLHEILEDAHKAALKRLKIKRPSTYIGFFITENKDAIKKEMLKTGSKNLITTANLLFKKLSEKEKTVYFGKANFAKGDYNSEMKKYNLIFKKEPLKVKERKITPFLLYQKHQELKGIELSRSELLKMFNDLTPSKKLTWILRFLGVNHGDKLSYDQYIKAKESLSKEDLQIIEDYEGKPKKIAPYNIFVREFFKNSQEKNLKDAMKKCSVSWKNMPADKKANYQSKINKIEFEKKMFEYLLELPEDRRNLEIDSNPKLSRKAFEKMAKKQQNIPNINITSNSSNKIINTTNNISYNEMEKSKKSKEKQFTENFTYSQKERDATETVTIRKSKDMSPWNSPESTSLFNKFRDDDSSNTEAEKLMSKKKAGKKSLFNKFNDVSMVYESGDMPKPISIKKETERKRKNSKSSDFPEPIKIEEETDSEDYRPKKCKKLDDSFKDFSSAHSSTTIENSPTKHKKKKRLESSSDTESIAKPPKTVYKYYSQCVYKGSKSNAKESFQKLSGKELKKLNAAFKKAQSTYLTDFEKKIESMTSEELERYARLHKNNVNEDESDID